MVVGLFGKLLLVALLAEGVDRNSMMACVSRYFSASPSSRRAWIEIVVLEHSEECVVVALLAEGVDRNIQQTFEATPLSVALLAEGVDRNRALSKQTAWSRVCRPPRGGRG